MKRDLAIGFILFITVIAVELLLYPVLVAPTIDAAWNGTSSLGWANSAVAGRVASDPELYDLEHLHWMGRTLATRFGVVFLAGLGCWLAWRHRERFAGLLRGFFTEKDTPFNIGVFRFVVFGMMFFFVGKEELPHYSSLPATLHFPPVGLGPALARMPASPELATVILVIFKTCCLFAMVGLFTRLTTILATVLALYVFGIPQMFGKVNHNHHLVWFAAVLASSRCGDALSVDALLRRMRGRPTPGQAIAYALPLRIIWVLLGLIYFFPGYWKLWGGGIDWIFGDHLRYQMYHLWSTHENPTSIPWISESKFMVTLGGIATIVFEILFIFLIFTRTTRVLAAIGGLCFHTAVGFGLRIAFHSLQLSYISLFDWRHILTRIGILKQASSDADQWKTLRRPTPLPTVIVGVIIIVPVLFLGFKGENNGWPFACYPRFSYPITEPERDKIEFEVTGADGRVLTNNTLDEVRVKFRTARWIGLLRRTLLSKDPELLEKRLQALYLLSESEPVDGETIRFYRATYSTIPDDWGNPPIRRELLVEFEVKPPS
ncbi:MAG: HTTM domain-containing protein [Phycisphaerales bacterium]|nr:HTTM domain-containing protein [Phycisphaerales bacterium]